MLLFYAGSIIAALHLRAASPGDAVALFTALPGSGAEQALGEDCLLYTSDAADDWLVV